jgi:hypothetical protein
VIPILDIYLSKPTNTGDNQTDNPSPSGSTLEYIFACIAKPPTTNNITTSQTVNGCMNLALPNHPIKILVACDRNSEMKIIYAVSSYEPPNVLFR